MASLQQRQLSNLWRKKTYDCDINEYFRRAPDKLKARIKKLIWYEDDLEDMQDSNTCLRSAIYECYRVDVSSDLCKQIVDHYHKVSKI